MPEVINHITTAEETLRHHWGWKGHGPALSRTTNKSLKAKNNRVACHSENSPQLSPGQSCDEYPFASTYEGAANNSDYSAVAVNAAQNSFAGTRLATFYQNNRIIDHDNFWVSP